MDPISRRDWLKTMGAAGAGALLPGAAILHPGTAILPLTSTSDVFIPPRGRAFHKFSFDFTDLAVEFGGLRFGVLVVTRENAYALDASAMTAEGSADSLSLTATRLLWAGGQERAAGRVSVRLRRDGDATLCDVTAEMDQPIKAVTTVVRGVPRGNLSAGGGVPFDPHDAEVLWGYPFGGRDLFRGNPASGLGTPLVVVHPGHAEV